MLYFIHSNYIEGKVMVELDELSEAFQSSVYFLVPITSNRKLALNWLTKSDLQIVTE